jgi:hypothetical protein
MYCDHHSTSWHQICSTLHYWSPRPVACDVPVPDVSPITIRVFLVSPHLQQTNNNHLRGKKTKRKHLPNRYSDPLSKRMVDPTIYQTKKWLIHQSIRKKKSSRLLISLHEAMVLAMAISDTCIRCYPIMPTPVAIKMLFCQHTKKVLHISS